MSHQQLIWREAILEDERTLESYGCVLKRNSSIIVMSFKCLCCRIRDGDTMKLVLKLRGGPLSTGAESNSSNPVVESEHGAGNDGDDYYTYAEVDVPDTPLRMALQQEYEELGEFAEQEPGQVTLVIFKFVSLIAVACSELT